MYAENKKLIIFIAITFLIFAAWQYIFPNKAPDATNTQATQTEESAKVTTNDTDSSAKIISIEESKKNSNNRITINTGTLQGSIDLNGFIIDDILLKKYHVNLDKKNNIQLLSPANTKNAYYLSTNWLINGAPAKKLQWSGSATNITSKGSYTFYAKIKGAELKKTITIDDQYLILIEDEIINKGSEPLNVVHNSASTRSNIDDVMSTFVFHEGPITGFDGSIEEIDYDDIEDATQNYSFKKGWMAFTDKYWLVAILPFANQNKDMHGKYEYNDSMGYRYSVEKAKQVIKPKDSTKVYTNIFIGPKEYRLLKQYKKQLDADKLDFSIDFGMFFFITQPFATVITYLYHSIGNFGLAILTFTILVRSILFPLSYKSLVSMNKMREMQPQMQALKAKHTNDMQRYNQELMKLYKKEKINPVAGCLPILLQVPVFFALYKVIFVNIEMRHAPFMLWIKDLSAPDPTSLFNLFGLLPYSLPDMLTIGVLPILMGITMFIQQKISAQITDPIQKKIFAFMPIVFTIALAHFPAGLVLYWIFSNIFSISQQLLVNYIIKIKHHKNHQSAA